MPGDKILNVVNYCDLVVSHCVLQIKCNHNLYIVYSRICWQSPTTCTYCIQEFKNWVNYKYYCYKRIIGTKLMSISHSIRPKSIDVVDIYKYLKLNICMITNIPIHNKPWKMYISKIYISSLILWSQLKRKFVKKKKI